MDTNEVMVILFYLILVALGVYALITAIEWIVFYARSLASWVQHSDPSVVAHMPVPPPAPTPPVPAPSPNPIPTPTAPIATPASVRPRWLEVVNDDPDRAPHVQILGGSGVGKTTMAMAIAKDRGGRFVVLSPKIKRGDWAGAEIANLDADNTYAPIIAMVQDLTDESRRRNRVLNAEGREAIEPLTIIIDELVVMASRLKEVAEFAVEMSSIGREINMRLIVIGTTDVALGVKGWAASRNNYVRIVLDESRRATITHGSREFTVAAHETQRLADGVTLRPWRDAPQPRHVPSHPTPPVPQVPHLPPPPPMWSAPTSRTLTPHERGFVMALADGSPPSRRIARLLYHARGGSDLDYDGTGGCFVAIQSALRSGDNGTETKETETETVAIVSENV